GFALVAGCAPKLSARPRRLWPPAVLSHSEQSSLRRSHSRSIRQVQYSVVRNSNSGSRSAAAAELPPEPPLCHLTRRTNAKSLSPKENGKQQPSPLTSIAISI